LLAQVAVALRPRWRRVAAPLAKLARLLHSPHVHQMLRAVLFHGVVDSGRVTHPTLISSLHLLHLALDVCSAAVPPPASSAAPTPSSSSVHDSAEALWRRSQAGDTQADAELASMLVALLHKPVDFNGFSPAWHDVNPSVSPLRVGHLPQQAVSTVQVRAELC
jgi:hypothetical protein